MTTALEREWKRRLRASGFVDIENDEGQCLHWSTSERPDHTDGAVAASLDAARELLRTHRFPSKVYRSVWQLHADGETRNGIAKTLNVSNWTVDRALEHGRSVLRARDERINDGNGGKDTGFSIGAARRLVRALDYTALMSFGVALARAGR